MSPQDLDPNITLGPEMILPAGGGGAAGAPPPGAAALTLRLPGDDGADGGQVSVSVQPGARVTLLGLIRNQSDVVDNFDLSIRGLPDDWWTIAPATAYLVPYGSGGTYEQEVQIHLHPPRTPQSQARPWSFEVVAVSRAFEGEVAAAAASVTIEPYTELGTELRPERASGRLKARYVLTVYNKANARTEVDLAAEDTDGECSFRFAEPRIALEPGNGMECPFTVFPPKQKWIGRPVDRQFQLTATPVGRVDPVPPRMATFRQRPWLPWWMSIVAPLVVAAAVLIVMLLPKQTVVPNLKGQPSAFAAQKLLNKIGLKLGKTTSKVDPKQKAGSVIDQSPAAGAKAKKGTVVDVVVVTGTGKATVPAIVGLPLGLAQQKLIDAGLALGAVQPQPPDPNGKISSQLPLAGTPVAEGFAVNVFQAAPVAAAGAKSKKGKAAAAAAAAAAAGGGAAAAAAAAAGNASAKSLAATAAQAGTGSIPIPKLPTDPTQAAQALANLGLVPQPVKQLSTAPVGQVAGTVPAEGAKVPKGAKVALIISNGSPQLAFDNGTQVNVIDPTSGKVTGQVPAGVGQQVEPSWSPDGQHLVYAQNGQLVLVEPGTKGSPPAVITHPPQGTTDHNPAFAPTTKAIVIAYIQRVGNVAHQLCFVSVTKFSQSNSCVNAPGFDLGGQVSWSPDGSTILVLGTKNNGANFGLLSFSTSVPFSGQASNWGQPTLQTNASVPQQGILAGAFSPDGKKMALVAGSVGNGFNLFIVKAGDFNPTQQDGLPVTACQISWRSDGKELAVMQANGPCGPAATGKIVGVDLSNTRNLTTLAPLGAHPSWQPVLGG
jgi:beta-lactam-binding protein with PASTA domain